MAEICGQREAEKGEMSGGGGIVVKIHGLSNFYVSRQYLLKRMCLQSGFV